jgi:hypothetical protein
MTDEELFEKLMYVCNRARSLGRKPAEIVGMLEIIKAAEVARCIKIQEVQPPIVRASSLPPRPPLL